MKTIDKPVVMARFFTDTNSWSEYGHIGINFSLIKSANYYDTPEFMLFDLDIAKRLVGLDNLMVKSQVAQADVLEKGIQKAHYGFQLSLDMREPALDGKLDSAVRAGKRIQKRIDKLSAEEGYANCLADYLKYVFRAMNVKYITHESYSECRYNQKWKGYKLSDIETIIERSTRELSDKLRWQLPMDDAA